MSKTVTLFSRMGIGDDVLSGEVEISAGKLVSIDETLTSEDTTFTFPIDVSALKAIFMVCDASLNVAFEASGGPHPFAPILAAGKPLSWNSEGYIDNPFGSTDVVSFMVTQLGSNARFQMKILTDPTP